MTPTAPLTLEAAPQIAAIREALPVLAYMRATGSEWSGFGSCRAGDVDSFAVVRLSDAQSALAAQAATIAQLEARLREAEADARRYRWMQANTAGKRDSRGRCEFDLPDPHPLSNIMQGSVAQHLDAAIDAAIAAHGKDEAHADQA